MLGRRARRRVAVPRPKELTKLSLVDATSFLLMKRHGIRRVLAFDSHSRKPASAMLMADRDSPPGIEPRQ